MMNDPLVMECEICPPVFMPSPRTRDEPMKVYSINTTEKYRPYALKYMRAHVLKYHKGLLK